MAEEIILYNLADNISDEAYLDYVKNEKGSLMESFPSVEKYELFKVTNSATGEIPYKYIGIMHIKDMEQFHQKDFNSPKFQEFLKKWGPMTAGPYILSVEKIY